MSCPKNSSPFDRRFILSRYVPLARRPCAGRWRLASRATRRSNSGNLFPGQNTSRRSRERRQIAVARRTLVSGAATIGCYQDLRQPVRRRFKVRYKMTQKRRFWTGVIPNCNLKTPEGAQAGCCNYMLLNTVKSSIERRSRRDVAITAKCRILLSISRFAAVKPYVTESERKTHFYQQSTDRPDDDVFTRGASEKSRLTAHPSQPDVCLRFNAFPLIFEFPP